MPKNGGMHMRLWQKAMIGLARSERMGRRMHGSRLMRRFSRCFVAGEDAAGGVQRAQSLKRGGRTASLFYLGEYVDSEELVRANVENLEQVIPLLAQCGLDVHVSVDPTQIGSVLSWDLCQENAERLARAVDKAKNSGRDLLMLDMEDSGVTENTLSIYNELRAKGLPAGVTIQAYLRRSGRAIEQLAARGATVRLVKGAFAENSDVALVRKREIDARYKDLAAELLSPRALDAGCYPVFGTHDTRMIDFVNRTAEAREVSREEYEFEMLLGVRPALQRSLVERGYSLRVYCPFGNSWWPYSIRRVGESARNLRFMARSVFGAVFGGKDS